ncbi:MAG: response regulator [Flavobacterium sp.]|nr:MAG: response regulator [Flavobacterium sp.]
MNYETILIDDDEMALCLQEMIWCNFVQNKQPYLFNRAQDALRFLDDRNDAVSSYMILLDINMPIMNGWEFLNQLKTHPLRNFIQVVMVSSSVEKTDIERALSIEIVEDFLIKPLTEQQLQRLRDKERLSPFFSAKVN